MTEAAAAPQIGDDLGDDIVLPFRTLRSGVIGRLVRLGPAIDTILSRHDMPVPVAQALGEAVALTTMLGAALKFAGKLIVQTKTDGIIDFLVVNFEAGGHVRGYARYDKRRFAELAASGAPIEQGALLGRGHLAITIDQGGDMDRYQGIVALEGPTLAQCVHHYFRQSEQIATGIKVAIELQEDDRWRGGALLVQRLPFEERQVLEADREAIDDNWRRTLMLAGSSTSAELTARDLDPDALLYRLFHEDGVRVFRRHAVRAECRCSRARIERVLRSLPEVERSNLGDADGTVTVTCEFCNRTYRFDAEAVAAIASA